VGPRRLLFELGKAGVRPLPSRSTIYRVLVRHHLVPARKRKRRRQDYKRWQREEPMELWQMDVTGSVFLADGAYRKDGAGAGGLRAVGRSRGHAVISHLHLGRCFKIEALIGAGALLSLTSPT